MLIVVVFVSSKKFCISNIFTFFVKIEVDFIQKIKIRQLSREISLSLSAPQSSVSNVTNFDTKRGERKLIYYYNY